MKRIDWVVLGIPAGIFVLAVLGFLLYVPLVSIVIAVMLSLSFVLAAAVGVMIGWSVRRPAWVRHIDCWPSGRLIVLGLDRLG